MLVIQHDILGSVIFEWLQSQCRNTENKLEYNTSQNLLKNFLLKDDTQKALSSNCLNAIRKLKENLASKEDKFAGYVRHTIKNCMDAMTTSPVESHNRVLKHGPEAIHPNYHLNTTVSKIMNSSITRLRLRKDRAMIETGKNNLASNSPTREFLIKKGQGLVDRNYDRRGLYKSVQLNPTKWISWYFDEVETLKDRHPLFVEIPMFLRVRVLELTSQNGNNFVSCSCNRREREGVPCSHFFHIATNAMVPNTDIIDIGMVDVRYLKMYNSHYGDKGPVGKLMYRAQNECFDNKNMGVCVTTKFSLQLKGTSDAQYPILGKYTSTSDYNEAKFVMNNGPCTAQELEKFRIYNNECQDLPSIVNNQNVRNDYDDGVEVLVTNAVDEFGVISDVGQQMKEGVAQSKVGGKKDNKRLLTENERDEWYKRHIDKVKEILYDERFTKSNMQHLEESMDNVILDAYENVNKVDEKKIGGDNRLEWFGTTGTNVKRPKRKKGRF